MRSGSKDWAKAGSAMTLAKAARVRTFFEQHFLAVLPHDYPNNTRRLFRIAWLTDRKLFTLVSSGSGHCRGQTERNSYCR